MKNIPRVLHVVNWYPNPIDTIEAGFVKGQIDGLHKRIPSDVLLIQVRYGKMKIISADLSERERLWLLQCPVRSWFIKEILTSLVLFYFLVLRYDLSKYSLINFHIAYPLLTYFHWFKRWIRIPVVITEHWSAYHFNFGVSKDLHRIKRIFAGRVPVITVSQSLTRDIERFSGVSLQSYILPNVVNDRIFRPVGHAPDVPVQFFMLGCWQFPKVPEVIVGALHALWKQGFTFTLRIGGYGPYEDALKTQVSALEMDSVVSFTGKLTADQAALEMQRCSFFVHASEYETFSLVCAEAMSCGAPVIASAVGGIRELVDDTNGVLVLQNSIDAWISALKKAFTITFDRTQVADAAHQRFSTESVGQRYRDIVCELIARENGKC